LKSLSLKGQVCTVYTVNVKKKIIIKASQSIPKERHFFLKLLFV